MNLIKEMGMIMTSKELIKVEITKAMETIDSIGKTQRSVVT